MTSNPNIVRVINSSISLYRGIVLSNAHKQRLPSLCRYRLASTKTDQPKDEEVASTQNEEKEQAVTNDKDNENEMQGQVRKLTEALKDNKDKYMRSLAEAENMRKRLIKQTEDARVFGIQSFCKDLLEVSDVLSTAIGSVPKEELNNSNPHLQNLYQGLNMTESQLLKVFKKHGLVSISPGEGEKFDPHVHEAMFQVPVQNKELQTPDTIAVVQKIGFKLHERTLRPAQVGVFMGS